MLNLQEIKTGLILSTGSIEHALSMCILRSLWIEPLIAEEKSNYDKKTFGNFELEISFCCLENTSSTFVRQKKEFCPFWKEKKFLIFNR